METKKTSFFQSSFWKRFGIGFILLLLAVGVFIASAVVEHRASKQAVEDIPVVDEQQQAEIIDARNKMGEQISNVSGVVLTRKESDDRIASAIFKYATTWDSAETYADARYKLLSNHSDLDQNSQFLSEFFPPLESMQIKDAGGKVIYDPFMDSINISFVSMNSYVIGVDEDVYSYFTEIFIQAKGPVGGTADGRIVAMYQMDADGHMLNPVLYMDAI